MAHKKTPQNAAMEIFSNMSFRESSSSLRHIRTFLDGGGFDGINVGNNKTAKEETNYSQRGMYFPLVFSSSISY